MAKPCEFVGTTKAVHNNTIATTTRENNRRVWSLSPMGSQPGMEKCYCACERLSIWLSCKAVGRGIGASNSTNEADRGSDSRLRAASIRTERLAPRWRYVSISKLSYQGKTSAVVDLPNSARMAFNPSFGEPMRRYSEYDVRS